MDFDEQSKNITQLDLDVYNKLPEYVFSTSEMHDVERRFLHGLIRKHRPKKILEIGVSRGGGSSIILNAIADLPDAKLVSIDILKCYGGNEAIPIGDTTNKIYPNGNHQWSLYTGVDPVEILPNIDLSFDFCVIDTAHVHPMESINFIEALPYLKNDAIVVLHDISRFIYQPPFAFPAFSIACRILFDTVVGEKIVPSEKYLMFPNIGAFKINSDTLHYIGSLFSALSFPWGMIPGKIDLIDAFIKDKYDNTHYEQFNRARILNEFYRFNGNTYKINHIAKSYLILLNSLLNKSRVIFYGAGKNSHTILQYFNKYGLRLPDLIWDINGSKIQSLNGIPVVEPDFSNLNYTDSLIITIIDRVNSHYIEEKLEQCHFESYITEQELRMVLALLIKKDLE